MDLQCINALVEIYNLTITGTNERPLNFVENKSMRPLPTPDILPRNNEKQSQPFNFPITTSQLAAQITSENQKPIQRQYVPEAAEFKPVNLPSRSASLPEG